MDEEKNKPISTCEKTIHGVLLNSLESFNIYRVIYNDCQKQVELETLENVIKTRIQDGTEVIIFVKNFENKLYFQSATLIRKEDFNVKNEYELKETFKELYQNGDGLRFYFLDYDLAKKCTQILSIYGDDWLKEIDIQDLQEEIKNATAEIESLEQGGRKGGRRLRFRIKGAY